jgi:hypothetical protein
VLRPTYHDELLGSTRKGSEEFCRKRGCGFSRIALYQVAAALASKVIIAG